MRYKTVVRSAVGRSNPNDCALPEGGEVEGGGFWVVETAGTTYRKKHGWGLSRWEPRWKVSLLWGKRT